MLGALQGIKEVLWRPARTWARGAIAWLPPPQFLPSSRAGGLPSSSLSVGSKQGRLVHSMYICVECTLLWAHAVRVLSKQCIRGLMAGKD
jgi:hypothetical protein